MQQSEWDRLRDYMAQQPWCLFASELFESLHGIFFSSRQCLANLVATSFIVIVNVGLCHVISLQIFYASMARGVIFMKLFAFPVQKDDYSRSQLLTILHKNIEGSIIFFFEHFYGAHFFGTVYLNFFFNPSLIVQCFIGIILRLKSYFCFISNTPPISLAFSSQIYVTFSTLNCYIILIVKCLIARILRLPDYYLKKKDVKILICIKYYFLMELSADFLYFQNYKIKIIKYHTKVRKM